MRLIERHPGPVSIEMDDARFNALTNWTDREIEDGLSSRGAQEALWREALRRYTGIPKAPARNVPVEGAPNIEVTIGAIACDAIYAQSIDLIFRILPIVTARRAAPDRITEESIKALQKLINWGVKNEWALRTAADHSLLDDVQLGTGFYYIPFVEHLKKTKVSKITSRAPRILTIPCEDVLVPGGAYDDVQRTKWLALRWWLTESELNEKADAKGWNISKALPTGAIGWVRNRREALGRTATNNQISELFEIWEIYAYFDVDGDGFAEDICYAWDRSARYIMGVAYNDYDCRPVEPMRFQLRSHLFYGMGVMDMIAPYEDEITDIHNFMTLNILLANARFWKARQGSVPDTMRVWPGKVQTMQDPDDLKPEQMADTYPSGFAAQAAVLSLAERRVGVNELNTPRPSQVLGSRTPGITALSLLQQVNRRFAPAFDGMRLGTAGAVRQCLFRYQERLKAHDREVEKHLKRVLGETDGELVIALLKDKEFDEAVDVELTASDASVNRDVDRQNWMLFANILSQYYQKTLELVAIAANPQTPEPVRSTARQIAEATGELVDRMSRTFDPVRDPEDFVIHIDAELAKIEGMNQQGLNGLAMLLRGATAAVEQGGNGAAALGGGEG